MMVKKLILIFVCVIGILWVMNVFFDKRKVVVDGHVVWVENVNGVKIYNDEKTGECYTADTPKDLINWPENTQ